MPDPASDEKKKGVSTRRARAKTPFEIIDEDFR
jgi:hypothetical protein